MRMKNKILGGAVLLIAAFSLNETQAATCAVPPTCAQLGYTMKKADCGEMPIMRCPFAVSDDNQVYCEGTVKVAALPILYGDGTVSKKLLSGKTPIGIVFDETNRLAIALTNVKKDGSAGSQSMSWTENGRTYNIPDLEDCVSEASILSCAVDGRANTNKMLACGDSCGGATAAIAANSYEPVGCASAFCKKGKWWLPSCKEWHDVSLVRVSMNVTTDFLKFLDVQDVNGGWCSNEYILNGWQSGISGSSSHFEGSTYGYSPVRPVVKY